MLAKLARTCAIDFDEPKSECLFVERLAGEKYFEPAASNPHFPALKTLMLKS